MTYLPIIISLLVLIIIDLYVYSGLRTSLSSIPWLILKKIILITHWSLTVICIIWTLLVFLDTSPPTHSSEYRTTYYLIGLILLLYVPKIIFIIFLGANDFIVLARKTIGYIAPTTLPATGENVSRIQFISQLGMGIAAIPFVGIAYGMIKGRYDFRIERVPISLPNLPDSFEGLTLVQLSDLHLGSFFDDKEPVKKAFQMVKDLDPDILVITGDWVNNFSYEAENWIEEFKSLPAKMAKLTIVGNHDYGDYAKWPNPEKKEQNFARLLEIHKEMGYQSLMNQNIILERNGEKIAIIGVENWGVKPFPQLGDLSKAKIGTEDIPVKILLSHDPSHFDHVVSKAHPDIDLTLSGHTHGAQFGIELGNIKWSPVKYKYPRWSGLYTVKNQRLYVNRGFGYLAFPGRVGMTPEITEFTFKGV